MEGKFSENSYISQLSCVLNMSLAFSKATVAAFT